MLITLSGIFLEVSLHYLEIKHNCNTTVKNSKNSNNINFNVVFIRIYSYMTHTI